MSILDLPRDSAQTPRHAEREPSAAPRLRRRLPAWFTEIFSCPGVFGEESLPTRWAYSTLAFVIAVGWFIAFHAYWTPCSDGVDQNGYLVGGRMFSEHLSTGMTPGNLFQYVGRMWIGTPWMTYYPKYPIGLPMIYAALLELGKTTLGRFIAFEFTSVFWGLMPVAIFLLIRSAAEIAFWQARQANPRRAQLLRRWRPIFTLVSLVIALAVTMIAVRTRLGPFARLPIDAPTVGVELCYLVCPLATMGALIATYQLARLITGSFAAILAMIAVGCSPITLELANNANSHASSLLVVAWGMFLLIRWWQSGGAWRAAGAGFLLGYAYTIRYTEGMLLLPIVLAALMSRPWRSRRSLAETALLLAWWLIPVLFLTCFNLGAFGSITGYDSTNESTGFSYEYFQSNWETTVRQMYLLGLFFLVPLAVAGLGILFVQRKRLALLLASWVIPSLILYTAYYWAPDAATSAYLRFYLTIFPPLAMLAFYVVGRVAPMALAALAGSGDRSRAGILLGCGIFAVVSLGVLAYAQSDLRWDAGDRPLLESGPQAARANAGNFGGGGGGGNRMGRGGMRRGGGGGGGMFGVNLFAGGPSRSEILHTAHLQDMKELSAGIAGAARDPALWIAVAIIAALVVLGCVRPSSRPTSFLSATSPSGAVVFGAGLLALCSGAMSVYYAAPDIETASLRQWSPATAADILLNTLHAPAGSVIFAEENTVRHLQFVGDYEMYNLNQFTTSYIRSLDPRRIDPDQPQTVQPERGELLYRLVGHYTSAQLLTEESRIVQSALRQHRPVYIIVSTRQLSQIRYSFFPRSRFTIAQVASWADAVPPPESTRQRFTQGFGGNVMAMQSRRNVQLANSRIRTALPDWVALQVTAVIPPRTSAALIKGSLRRG